MQSGAAGTAMAADEQKRNFFQIAVHNFFALYLGCTPPSPGQELFYGGLLLGATAFLIFCGYLMVHFLLSGMLR
jgi:hypothetical protein